MQLKEKRKRKMVEGLPRMWWRAGADSRFGKFQLGVSYSLSFVDLRQNA